MLFVSSRGGTATLMVLVSRQLASLCMKTNRRLVSSSGESYTGPQCSGSVRLEVGASLGLF